MGFFVGWKFFSSDKYYSEEANAERRQLARDQKRAKDRRAKARKKKQEAKRKAKEIRAQESGQGSDDDYYSSVNDKYGSGKGNPNIDNGSTNFKRFSSNEIDRYVNDIEKRYSKFYNSASGEKAGKVNRGFGAGPSQGIKRPDGVKHHGTLGRMGQSKRVPLGYKGPKGATKRTGKKLGSSKQAAKSSEGSGLKRPY